jgi:Fibronectin type III domain
MRRFLALATIAPTLFAVSIAHADSKRCIAAEITPSDDLQIVVWLEDASGNFIDTLFITQQTGTYGLGNRPGRFDFNSGPMWPYGRRLETFPVWSHRNGQSFPSVIYQNDPTEDPSYCQSLAVDDPSYAECGENDLSHSTTQSSNENHYCHPLLPSAFDAMTCPSQSFTDKGRFSQDSQYNTGYPPRADVTPAEGDSSSVAMYQALNPYDAVSQPTPVGGADTSIPWAMPSTLPDGDYVLWVETSAESDFNATYNATSQPSPQGLAWSAYGVPTRGQPSVVYSVPISISSAMPTVGETQSYAGYGDPLGADGNLRAPDATITSDTPSSGASRLQLVADGSDMYRVRVTASPDDSSAVPNAPDELAATAINGGGATITFAAPGIGTGNETVAGYDVRVLADTPMTDDNFMNGTPITSKVQPVAPGSTQSIVLTGLLPLTDYWVGVRAYNGCDDDGPLAIIHITTTDRESGTVDACFVATAAYGSLMANDVELLRHFRDAWLETNVVGELGVEAYYTFGPALAGIIGESDLLRATARDALSPIVQKIHTLRR